MGIPVIGCDCPTCLSDDPKDQRMRSSIHLQTPTHSILVDSGPDLRQQALRYNLRKVDAVLYTHCHLDHIAGFDELRAFCWRRDAPLPMYSSQSCLDELARMYAWAFAPENTTKATSNPPPNSRLPLHHR
ncbi:MBL fold metallo-hydrolase [Rubritalea tangerina]|uniref:MBL fold metallo-hydrolase n=1 Tax=Rubritalea tangerina TaxID=430798 RepID=UPI00361C5F84